VKTRTIVEFAARAASTLRQKRSTCSEMAMELSMSHLKTGVAHPLIAIPSSLHFAVIVSISGSVRSLNALPSRLRSSIPSSWKSFANRMTSSSSCETSSVRIERRHQRDTETMGFREARRIRNRDRAQRSDECEGYLPGRSRRQALSTYREPPGLFVALEQPPRLRERRTRLGWST